MCVREREGTHTDQDQTNQTGSNSHLRLFHVQTGKHGFLSLSLSLKSLNNPLFPSLSLSHWVVCFAVCVWFFGGQSLALIIIWRKEGERALLCP